MGYLREFIKQIDGRNFQKFLTLWEEYCASDSVDVEEFKQLLKILKSSEIAKPFGQVVEQALPLWKTIQNEKDSYEVLRLLIDLQTTNSPALAEIALEVLNKTHGQDPKFNDRLRLIGLRNKDQFQGAISKYDLLAHMASGNAVFHTGGWGTGEIIDVSFVREHLLIEFEKISGRKDLSFANAFKTLIPLPSDNFLARRFSNPDQLEKDGKEDPVELVTLLLRDLGPKSASEIKDELCELVIPEKDWTKWWQGARAKLKKNPMIEVPESLKDSFQIRKIELSPEERLKTTLEELDDLNKSLQLIYNYVRDTTNALKDPELKQFLINILTTGLKSNKLSEAQSMQIILLMDQFFNYQPEGYQISTLIKNVENVETLINQIDILAFKKRALIAIKENRSDWKELFLLMLFTIPQVQLRDYLLKELNQGDTRELVEARLKKLLSHPANSPETFVWYFQKLINDEEADLPFNNFEGRGLFLESFLILYHQIENKTEYRDLVKKMYNLIAGERYALIRKLLQGTTLEFAKEFLLLASKCQGLNHHDMKILQSLVEVVHPSLAPEKQRKGSSRVDDDVVWTTEEGYMKTQERIQQIGTIEMIDNAREIEAARALGDLRENSEFKFAQERRARLQSELKSLSEQLGHARVITKDDIHPSEVSVGSVIQVVDPKGTVTRYSILGPWDTDPERNILSFNSKFAQAMLGKKKGETFHFKDEEFKILHFNSFFE